MLDQNQKVSRSPDLSLVLRAQEGEAEAFDCLFAQHKNGVYACLWHMLGGDAEAVEEAVGNVFISVFKSLKRFRGDSSFSTWVYRIAINEARARIRQKRRWGLLRSVALDDQIDTPDVDADDPAAETQRREDARVLRRAV